MSAVSYDHIVLGVGGMGSATLFELARRGHRVLGLERFDVPHAMGSSHGQTRIIRLAYNEHSNYVPLLQRAYELWDELETRAGEELLVRTGGLDVGPRDGRIVSGSLAACREHGLDHELMDAEEARRRYPGLAVDDTFSAVFQPDAGYLRPERCVVSYAAAALERGATIHAREPVVSWSHDGDVYRVDTTKGQYETPSLVVTAGPWAAQMIAELGPWARPQRQVVGWFQPHRPELFARDHLPVFILDLEEGEYYGFPIDSQMPGFKIGRFYHREQWVDPDEPRAEADLPKTKRSCGRPCAVVSRRLMVRRSRFRPAPSLSRPTTTSFSISRSRATEKRARASFSEPASRATASSSRA